MLRLPQNRRASMFPLRETWLVLRLRGLSFSALIWPMLLEGFVGDLPGLF